MKKLGMKTAKTSCFGFEHYEAEFLLHLTQKSPSKGRTRISHVAAKRRFFLKSYRKRLVQNADIPLKGPIDWENLVGFIAAWNERKGLGANA